VARGRSPSEEALIRTLWQDLDRGESEAIALAKEKGTGRILLDKREGRRRARNLGLEVTGALGVLLREAREGTLDSLPDALDALEEEAGFWISSSLRRHILEEVD
jgi:predicted nucleic acid-binding protein